MNHNLYAALRAQFPSQLDTTAVETDDGLHYSWRDLERASAMLANLLDGLNIPKGARVAVQVEKSVEAMMLYLATLRAGYVFLPLNTAYQSAEIEYFIENAEPAMVVCSGANFGWVSKIAFKAGTQYVFTLNDNRTGQPVGSRHALFRPAQGSSKRNRRHGRYFVHERYNRTEQRCDVVPWQFAQQRPNSQNLLGLAHRRCIDPRLADLSRTWTVRSHPRRFAQR